MDLGQERSRPEASTLLVRRATREAVAHVAQVLGPGCPPSGELARLADAGGLLTLGDVALPPSAPPVAAAAFDLDRSARAARLVAVGVVTPLRRHGLGRRLFEGAAMLLRSEGIERVRAPLEPGTAVAAYLVALGFGADDHAPPGHLVYWL